MTGDADMGGLRSQKSTPPGKTILHLNARRRSEDEIDQEALVALEEGLGEAPGLEVGGVAGVEGAVGAVGAEDLDRRDGAAGVDLQGGAHPVERAPVRGAQAGPQV